MVNAENHGLLDLFEQECQGHLDEIRARLPALNSTAGAAPAAAAIADSLHTLAGAARSIDLTDLEYLCRALERLVQARTGAAWDAASIAPLDAALTLAPQLLAAPSGRVRNQAMALAARCDAAGAQR